MSQTESIPSCDPKLQNVPLPLVPYLTVPSAKEAHAFYTRALGAEILGKVETPDGRVIHSCIRLPNGGAIYVADDFPEWAGKSFTPKSIGGSPVAIHLEVPDVDAAWKRALDAGAEVVHALEDTFWGARYGELRDPFGHRWSLSTQKRAVSPAEMETALRQMGGGAK